MKFQQENQHHTQAFTEHNSCLGKYEVSPHSTISNINVPTDTEPPSLACTFNQPARVTISFKRFQTTGSIAITLFIHFLGLQHERHTNDDSSKYLCLHPYKNCLKKQVSPESSAMTQQTCRSVLYTNHSTTEKRSPRTHITYTSSVTDMFYYM